MVRALAESPPRGSVAAAERLCNTPVQPLELPRICPVFDSPLPPPRLPLAALLHVQDRFAYSISCAPLLTPSTNKQ
jgi:hypothetical protein